MRCLLLVDNCEHVVADAAEIVADLLNAGGQLRVLATSREPLGVPGEVTYQVQSWPSRHSRDAARAASRRRLRCRAPVRRTGGDRVARLRAHRRHRPGRRGAVPAARRATAGDRAGRLPRAQLRAGRAGASTSTSASSCSSAGARTALPRQRTLRGAIDWSYDLLDDDERTLFDRLGVFPADFDYEAARVGMRWRRSRRRPSSRCCRGWWTSRWCPLSEQRHWPLPAAGDDPRVRRRTAGCLRRRTRRPGSGTRPTTWRWPNKPPSCCAPRHQRTCARPADHRAAEPARRVGPQHRHRRHRIRLAVGRRAATVLGRSPGSAARPTSWIQRALAIGDPPATPAVVAGLAAASAIMQPSDARAAFDLATRAAQLAAGLDDLTGALAARAVGMGAIWVQPGAGAARAVRSAWPASATTHPWERAVPCRPSPRPTAS